MHGLIFKTKESHRQDQSESIVIHVENIITTTYSVINYNFSSISQQVKRNHFIMTSVDLRFSYTNMYTITSVVSSRRNKTNPHFTIKNIPVLNATLILAFKPKRLPMIDYKNRSTSSQFIRDRSWDIFNRFHIFALCDDNYCNIFIIMLCFIQTY